MRNFAFDFTEEGQEAFEITGIMPIFLTGLIHSTLIMTS